MLKNPFIIFFAGFLSLIFVGSLLLFLPVSHVGEMEFLDALFTSASAVCVTGLVVNNIGSDFSIFGQIIILVLIQLGGFGVLFFSSLLFLIYRGNLSFAGRQALQIAFSPTHFLGFYDFLKRIIIFTLFFELIGAFLLFFKFILFYKPMAAIYYAIFHSVSAFCNSGFSLFANSLITWRYDIFINSVMMGLIIVGGIGYITLFDIHQVLKNKKKGFSLQTKMIVLMNIILIISGTILLYILQLGSGNVDILSSLFQSVTARTAGFNTRVINGFSSSSLLVIVFLMFIGASSGSTGGGIKTNTFFVILLAFKKFSLHQTKVKVFKRSISDKTIMAALTLFFLFIILIFLGSLTISISNNFQLKEIFFEVTSALGTVGLSLGITSQLNTIGKITIIILMFCGRVGPLVMLRAFSYKTKELFYFPQEEIMIG